MAKQLIAKQAASAVRAAQRREALAPPEYVARVPRRVPRGKVLVHNNVKPTRRLGMRGFRAWLANPSKWYVECTCGWAPHLKHYRVARIA
jgi:hypothetical protein